MSKIALIVIGVLVVLMGLYALIAPGSFGVYDPAWHAIAKIIVGAVGIIIGAVDKK